MSPALSDLLVRKVVRGSIHYLKTFLQFADTEPAQHYGPLWAGPGSPGRTDRGAWARAVIGYGEVVEERLAETDGLGEVVARGCWRSCPVGVLGPCCPACLGSTGSGPGVSAVQLLGRSPGSRCLRGVLLSLSKLGHGGS